jgi:hypothetical protein
MQIFTVPGLVGDAQEMSDSEIFFVVANGVALSGMPAFGAHRNADEIWKMVCGYAVSPI